MSVNSIHTKDSEQNETVLFVLSINIMNVNLPIPLKRRVWNQWHSYEIYMYSVLCILFNYPTQ